MVGHFPVLFRSKDENSFAVDKPEQAKIMEKVRAFCLLQYACFCLCRSVCNAKDRSSCCCLRVSCLRRGRAIGNLTIKSIHNTMYMPYAYAYYEEARFLAAIAAIYARCGSRRQHRTQMISPLQPV